MKHLSTKKNIIACAFICYFANAFGFNNQEPTTTDSINVARLYEVSNKVKPFTLTFSTEEQTIQAHDGQDVFRDKRTVEYRVTETDSKIVIKRKVLHSEKAVLVADKNTQDIYFDATSVLLCGLLKPQKTNLQELAPYKVACSYSQSNGDSEITLYKINRLSKREETYLGETVRFEDATEKLQYKSGENKFMLDGIKKIVSKLNLSVIHKNGTKHKVDIVETVVIL